MSHKRFCIYVLDEYSMRINKYLENIFFRVVAIDQRGYGDSDKPSSVSDYSLMNLTNDLRQLVAALGEENF